MKYIRTITEDIKDNLSKKPIIVLYGARQVGKTTLVKTIMSDFENPLYLMGDDPKDVLLLEKRSGKELSQLVAGHDLVVIDEAQRVENIEIILKLIADNNPDAKVIATGSSSFDLANKVSEPLTGRNRKFYLYPLSLGEVVRAYGAINIKKQLETYITFGMYPQIVRAQSRAEKALLSKELVNDYLFKDLFLFGDIRNAFAFEKLVKLIALRVGSEISYTELAKEIGISRDTVLNYVTLLEQSFIIFRLTPLYTNKTKEVNKKHKIYFYDTGIRNAILGAHDPLGLRQDKGALFENFFIAEKVKQKAYAGASHEIHFWRNRQDGEVDFVESYNQGEKIFAYECKWKEIVGSPVSFKNLYPNAKFKSVNLENIVDIFST
jgi:predicted AAA+ superfamily ATPase